MLESRFGSIISRSSTDVGRTKLHTLDVQVTEGSLVFVKQYTIPLKYQNFINNETKRLEEAGLISRSLSNWSAPFMVVPKKQDPDNPSEVQLRMVIDYRQLNKRIITSRAPDRNVFSRTAEDHMEHLERIFAALQIADLKIKVSKCEFFKKYVSYLGFLIGETGIHCDRSKVEAINKIATPTSIKEFRQFNGMCSYYRKFISHHSDISKCFNDMTKKGATFNWTKEFNAAFKLLKEKLMEDPVLISPQVDKDYVIHCDASKYSYSGILQQTRPGTEELAPLAYFSGNFNKTQVKWNITEKEAYAIYKSVKKFTFYITGVKTTIFSDHKPLKNFFEGGMNITKLDRRSLELQEFDISLEFIQGKLNTVANVISRLKNGGLYQKHSNEDQKINTATNLDERIKEVLDIASKPLNFEKVFSMDTVISRKELLLCQKRDRFCWKLVRTTGRHSDFMINHEGLLVKQVSILRNAYRVYVLLQSLVQ